MVNVEDPGSDLLQTLVRSRRLTPIVQYINSVNGRNFLGFTFSTFLVVLQYFCYRILYIFSKVVRDSNRHRMRIDFSIISA